MYLYRKFRAKIFKQWEKKSNYDIPRAIIQVKGVTQFHSIFNTSKMFVILYSYEESLDYVKFGLIILQKLKESLKRNKHLLMFRKRNLVNGF